MAEPEHDCDECAVYAEHDTDEARAATLARISETGWLAYVREMRARLRANYPYRKCLRCWLKEMARNVYHAWHSPRRLAFHLVTEVGTRARHPQQHSRWFGTCLDVVIADFAEWVDREVAHTEMSCQGTDGDPKNPPYLIVTTYSWPALRAWLLDCEMTVSETPWHVAHTGDSVIVDSDIVASPRGDLTTVWLGVPVAELLIKTYRGVTCGHN